MSGLLRLRVLLVMLAVAIAPAGVVLAMLAPEAYLGHAATAAGIAALFTAQAIGSLIGTASAGLASLVLAPRTLLGVGLLLEACSAGLAARDGLTGAAPLIALGMITGGAQTVAIAGTGLVPQLLPQQRVRCLPLMLGIGMSATMLLPLACGGLTHALPLQAHHVVQRIEVALAVALLSSGALLAWARVPATPAPLREAARTSGSAAWPWAVIAPVVCLGAIHGGVDCSVQQWAPTYLTRTFPHTAFPAAWVMTGIGAAIFTMRLLLAAYLRDGRRARRLVRLAPLAGAALLTLAAVAPSGASAAVALIAACACYCVEYPSLLAMVAEDAAPQLPLVLAGATAGGAGCWCLFTALVGMLDTHVGLRGALLPLPSLLLCFAVGAWWAYGRRLRPAVAPRNEAPVAA